MENRPVPRMKSEDVDRILQMVSDDIGVGQCRLTQARYGQYTQIFVSSMTSFEVNDTEVFMNVEADGRGYRKVRALVKQRTRMALRELIDLATTSLTKLGGTNEK